MQHPAVALTNKRQSRIAPAAGLLQAMRAGTFAMLLCLLAMLVFGAHSVHAADGDDGDFELTLQRTDTLIAIGKRLLIDPNRWPDLQKRNNIADPLRLVPGSILVIPKALLRVDPAEVVVRSVVGPVSRADGTPLSANERLAEGAGVKTADNGYVTLPLVDGSTLRLQPRSDLKVERARRVPGDARELVGREAGRALACLAGAGWRDSRATTTAHASEHARATPVCGAGEPDAGARKDVGHGVHHVETLYAAKARAHVGARRRMCTDTAGRAGDAGERRVRRQTRT